MTKVFRSSYQKLETTAQFNIDYFELHTSLECADLSALWYQSGAKAPHSREVL
jgi:hypothetical protein